MEGRKRLPKAIGVMAAHVLSPWIDRVFANLKRLALASIMTFAAAICRPTSTSSFSVGTGDGTNASRLRSCSGLG